MAAGLWIDTSRVLGMYQVSKQAFIFFKSIFLSDRMSYALLGDRFVHGLIWFQNGHTVKAGVGQFTSFFLAQGDPRSMAAPISY
jgi:hypothetical protein